MMRRFLPLLLLSSLLLNSCEFQSYEEYGIKPYDGALSFTEITKKSQWKNRFDHAVVSYKDKLWVLGGYNPGEVKGDTYYEDVWSSVDGVNWELVNENAPWLGRRGHAVVVFDDGDGEAMYLLGGFSVDESSGYRQYCNDIWRSFNGKDWELIKERSYPELDSSKTWFPRMDHEVVVANHQGQDYMFIIGGRTQLENHSGIYAQEYFNDVWRSSDARHWEKLPNNNYGRRAGHASAVDPATGTIYIQGGKHGVIFEGEENASHPIENWNYLWSSPDGITWTATYASIVPVSYMERSEHKMIFYKNTLWVFPGATTSLMHYHFAQSYHYPIWRMDPGNLWSIDSKGSDINGRHSYGLTNMDDKLWVLGGFTSNMGQDNDVWSVELK